MPATLPTVRSCLLCTAPGNSSYFSPSVLGIRDLGGPLPCQPREGRQLSFPAPNSSCSATLVSLRALFRPERPRTLGQCLAPGPDPFSFCSCALGVKDSSSLRKSRVPRLPELGFCSGSARPGGKSHSPPITQMSAWEGASEVISSALSLEAQARSVQVASRLELKVSSAFPEGSEPA